MVWIVITSGGKLLDSDHDKNFVAKKSLILDIAVYTVLSKLMKPRASETDSIRIER